MKPDDSAKIKGNNNRKHVLVIFATLWFRHEFWLLCELSLNQGSEPKNCENRKKGLTSKPLFHTVGFAIKK